MGRFASGATSHVVYFCCPLRGPLRSGIQRACPFDLIEWAGLMHPGPQWTASDSSARRSVPGATRAGESRMPYPCPASMPRRARKLLEQDAAHFADGEGVGLGGMALLLDNEFGLDAVDMGTGIAYDPVVASFQRTLLQCRDDR